jgi:carbon storage regulator CsrA
MLIIKRWHLESLQIGPDVVVTVLAVGNQWVELGVTAPRHLEIRRNDLRARPVAPESRVGCATLHLGSATPKELNR